MEDRRVVGVRILNGFALEDARGKTIELPNRKACGIIAYLALQTDASESRERLAGLFWSDRPEHQARASLRQCLRQIRSALASDDNTAFTTDRVNVSLSDEGVEVDLKVIADQFAQGTVHTAVVNGEFTPDRLLYGFDSLDQSFATWLQIFRQHWQDRIVAALEHLLRSSDTAAAVRHDAAVALVHIDQTHEEAQRHLIARYADAGNSAAAMRQYNLLWQVLDEDFDAEPSPETQELIVAIKAGTYRRNIPSGSAASLAEAVVPDAATQLPVIGVNEFVQGGPASERRHLVEGFRRELIASLVRFREWVVVELGFSGATAAASQEAPPAGQTGHNYKLEGIYLDDGDQVGLVITLKETETARYIWSERLDLNLDSWFDAQQQLVRRISLAVNVHISTERLSRRVARPDLPSDIHDKWLHAQQELVDWNPDAERRADAAFREIIAEAPGFAPAYSGLAGIANGRHFKSPGTYRSADRAAEALEFAQKAVELDPLDTRNHLALAWSNAMNGRFEQAEIHFSLAHQYNPNSPTTLIPCAHGLSYCGRHELANELADLAVKLHPALPLFQWGYIICIRFFNRDYRGAIAAGEIAQSVITDLLGWQAAALALADRRNDARDTAEEFLAVVRKRWHGSLPCSDEDIVAWFLHCFPIRRREDLDLLRKGLVLAGLPVSP